jgi:hypothetical protein
MSWWRCVQQAMGDEGGAVAVLVAVMFPVLFVFSAFAIDGPHWFLDARHLQLQADAGVLAGAQGFNALSCSDTTIENAARNYAGLSGGGGTVYNQLTGLQTTVYPEFNSQTYYPQPSPPPTDTTTFTGSPCKDEMLDLKLTETDLPWYMQAFNLVGIHGGINAHARVSIFQQTTGSGFLPIAVDESAPVAATAYVIDEDASSSGAISTLATIPLIDTGKNSQGQDVWASASPVPVTISKPHVGVVVALSGDKNNTTCPSNSQFVNCFDLSPGPSLIHIQGYATSGTGATLANPVAGSVTLQGGTCADGYFSAATSSCTIGIAATVYDGTTNTTGVTVSATLAGTSYALKYQTTGAYTGQWTATGMNLPAATGSNGIDLTVKCDATVTGSPCYTGKSKNNTSATISDVQRAYAAGSATSGTIENAIVSENGVGDANSFALGSTHNLSVTVDVAGSLQDAQSVSDPLYVMRFGSSTSASQTGAVACPPGGQGGFKTNLINGCSGLYAINTTDAACANTDPTKPTGADCVNTDNGLKTGQLRQGLSTRFANASCPNHWSSYPNIPNDDPRIVAVFITAYGSFGGSGNTAYPIQNFAAFYVTGWDGDPCGSDDAAGKDQLVGHFIKYINPFDSSGGGTQLCQPNSFGTCVAVLTR